MTHHAAKAHRNMSAPYMANGLPVADLRSSKDFLHLAAEGGEFFYKAQLRHHLQDDARDLKIQALADLAQRLVAGHRSKLVEEIHVEAQESTLVRVENI